MRRSDIIAVAVVVALQYAVTANAFAADRGRNKPMGYCFDAAFDGETNKLYVAGGQAGTHVFEVDDGRLNFVTTVSDGGYHRNLKIAGGRVYLADAQRGLAVYDITGEAPVCKWIQQDVKAMGIYVHGKHAYLAVGAEGLHVFDITTPDNPKLIGKCRTNADAWDVWVSGKYAYVADLTKGLTVVDVSRPSQPRRVSSVTWDEEKPMAEIVRGEGEIVYVAAGKHGLIVIDVSSPENPTVVSRYTSGTGGFGEGLCVQNGLVYLANGNNDDRDQNGLIVVDARNPESLKVKGKCTFDGWVEGVCLAGDYAFVTNTWQGIRSVDIRNPNSPRLVDRFGPTAEDLDVEERANMSFDQATHALARGEYTKAAELFEYVAEHQPGRNWAWFWLGSAYYELGQYERAIEKFDRVFEMFETHSLRYCNYARGLAYARLGRHEAAKADWQICLPPMIQTLRAPREGRMFEYADHPMMRYGKYTPSGRHVVIKMINRLRLITGRNFGYDPNAKQEENEAAVAAWEKWFKDDGRVEFTPDAELIAATREHQTIEYVRKTKREILAGRRFHDLSTPAGAFLTFVSTFRHKDHDLLKQVCPVMGHDKDSTSPTQWARLLDDLIGPAVVQRIDAEDRSPRESDLCNLYTSESVDKKIGQVWTFGYVEGAWRFLNSTSNMDDSMASAQKAAASTRSILQQEEEADR